MAEREIPEWYKWYLERAQQNVEPRPEDYISDVSQTTEAYREMLKRERGFDASP